MSTGTASLPAAVAMASTAVSSRPCCSSGVTASPRRSTAMAPASCERLLLVGHVGVASLVVVAAGRSGVGQDVDDGPVLLELLVEGHQAASCS